MGGKIAVRPGFVGFVCLFALLDTRGFLLPFALSAAAHEAGHLLALRALQIPVRRIVLGAGGITIRAELPAQLRQAWAVAAGPAVNALLCLLFLRRGGLWLYCNAVLLCYNLLPLGQLDGARLCRLLLPALFGPAGERACRRIGQATILGLVLAAVWAGGKLPSGPLPLLVPLVLLLRLPKGLAKSEEDW